MIFFVAKGAPDSCGPDCDTWIAAHGDIDAGAAARFQKFLGRLGKRDLPVIVHSPGGHVGQALAVGRMFRARQARVIVGLTIPDGCEGLGLDTACDARRKSNREVPSRLGTLSSCWSACVFMLAAGQTREVPAGATVKVHGVRIVSERRGRRVEAAHGSEADRAARAAYRNLDRYLGEVGGDPALAKLASTVSPDFFHTLNREEIFRYGLDRREISDTGWFSAVKNGKRTAEIRLFRKGWDGGDNFTEVGFRFACGPDDKMNLEYFARPRPADTVPRTDVVIGVGERKIRLFPTTFPSAGTADPRATSVERDAVMQFRTTKSISIAQVVDGKEVLSTSIGRSGFADLINEVINGCSSPEVIADTPVAPVTFGTPPVPALNIPGLSSPFGPVSNAGSALTIFQGRPYFPRQAR